MTTSITLDQDNYVSKEDNGDGVLQDVYVSHNEITASTNIPRTLFVLSVTNDEYDRVASTYDIARLSDDKATAIANSSDYYLVTNVSRNHATLVEAILFSDHVKDRLSFLVKDYPRALDDFVGANTMTFTAE